MHVPSIVHAARLVVKPRPSTLSESFAVLRYLKRWGEVVKFKKHTGPLPETGTNPFHDQSSEVYAVDFSSLIQPLETSSNKKHGIQAVKFKLDANAGHPNPLDLDPYNVRGLLDRKPSLQPRRFNCKLIMLDTNQTDTVDNAKSTSQLQDLTQNETEKEESEYSDPFTVDKDSIWGPILRQAGAPKHMIAGLLPKIDEAEPNTVSSSIEASMKKKLKVSAHFRRKRAAHHPKAVKKDDFSLMKLYRGTIKS